MSRAFLVAHMVQSHCCRQASKSYWLQTIESATASSIEMMTSNRCFNSIGARSLCSMLHKSFGGQLQHCKPHVHGGQPTGMHNGQLSLLGHCLRPGSTATELTLPGLGPGTPGDVPGRNTRQQAVAMTNLIKATQNLQELQQLVMRHGSTFNPIHIAAAFNKLKLLSTASQQQTHTQQQPLIDDLQDSPQPACSPAFQDIAAVTVMQQQLCNGLSSLWAQQLEHATPREVSTVLVCCSRLPVFNPNVWRRSLAFLLKNIDFMNAQDVSTAAHALAAVARLQAGRVPGLARAQVIKVAQGLERRICTIATAATSVDASPIIAAISSSSSGSSRSSSKSRSRRPPGSSAAQSWQAVTPNDVSCLLWSEACLKILPLPDRLSQLLQWMAAPHIAASLPVAELVTTLWSVSRFKHLASLLQHGPSLHVRRARLARAGGSAGSSAGSSDGSSDGCSSSSQEVQQAESLWPVLPAELLAPRMLNRLAASNPGAVSKAVQALSSLATGKGPHVLDVAVAQACITRLLQGGAAASLGTWDAELIGAVFPALQAVGVLPNSFLQAVLVSQDVWVPQAGAKTVAQVALGLAGLKQSQCSSLLGRLVQRTQELLKERRSQWQVQGDQRFLLVADLSWSIARLNQEQLARDVQLLIMVSGIKQQGIKSSRDACKLWAVHAWLVRHKLSGLTDLLTEAQLASCAAASRHVLRAALSP